MKAIAWAVLGASVLLAGCGVFGIGSSSDAPKPTPLVDIRSPSVVAKAAWTVNVGKSANFRLQPELEGGKVYAANADGAITILEEDTGRVLAKIDTKKKISGGVAVEGSTIMVGTLKGEVLAYDITGKERWTTNVAGEVISPAAMSRNMAVVRTADGRIFGLAMADGKRQWVYQRPSPSLMLRSEVGALAIGGDVVAGYPGGKLIALDIDDGKLTWEVTVMQPRGATELERIADVAGAPAVDGPRICAAAFQGKVACFEIQSRNMVWSRDVSSARGLAVDAKNLYISDDTGHVHALDKAAGTSLWKQEKLAYRRITAPVIVSGNVVVGDAQGYLHVLASADGAFIGRIATDGTPIHAIVATTGGALVQTAGGSVVMIRM